MSHRKFKVLINTIVLGTSLSVLAGSGSFKTNERERGSQASYDPGPKKDSLWIPMFGSVPNYRKIGKDYLGQEKFRWNIGPMWYRGRLGEDQVKVLVVGQEGAQDENTSNRTFTGGTGTKTQNMLAGLEMDRSYLFLNTFVYTIFNQRPPDPKKGENYSMEDYLKMEQGLDSPIVKYRHQLMDYTAQYNSNSLSMMVAVGAGARESMITWIESRGGKCPGNDPNKCDTTNMKIYKQEFGDQRGPNKAGLESIVDGVKYTDDTVQLKNETVVIHVPHPGIAGKDKENGLATVRAGFKRAADRITSFIEKNPTWMDGKSGRPRPDTGSTDDIIRNMNNFSYRNSPAPHWDFAFATSARLGDGGTNTVRDGQDAIVMNADGEEYGSKGRTDDSIVNRKLTRDGRNENEGRPWEPPRWNPRKPEQAASFDYGPCGYIKPGETCAMSEALMSWPDFAKLSPKPTMHPSFGIGASYRGNPRHASLVILADQFSYDDVFTARALTGEVGQRLQTWLDKNGYDNSDDDKSNDYVIIRSLPVDTLKMSDSERNELATNPDVLAAVRRILTEVNVSGPESMRAIALGKTSQLVAKEFDDLFEFESLDVNGLPKDLTDIARVDLPYSTRYFMGTSGNRSSADGGKYYRFEAPKWVKKTPIPNR
ncbi:MAG: hypothetical protein KDD25_00740 [Bdellovibrionales bacterium]|nr:hypothetical protein [Bdellovibrionales bacterium]